MEPQDAKSVRGRNVRTEGLESLVGAIGALRWAITGVRSWTRGSLRLATNARRANIKEISLTTQCRQELSFLGPHIETWGPIGLPIRTDKVDVEMHTDAGEFGYGGHL